MSDQFIGEVRMFAFDFAPEGWAACDGQLIPVSQNTALFALLGTTYGGNGQTTFAVPDLRGRAPLKEGKGVGVSDYLLGEEGGTETVKLVTGQLPVHTHGLSASSDLATDREPQGKMLAQGSGVSFYDTTPPNVTMAAGALAKTGGDTEHNNMQPYTTLMFCIAVDGEFPKPS